MSYDLTQFKKGLESKTEWLRHELTGIRTRYLETSKGGLFAD